MKSEKYAVMLILFALCMGMLLTAATSGCDVNEQSVTAPPSLRLSE